MDYNEEDKLLSRKIFSEEFACSLRYHAKAFNLELFASDIVWVDTFSIFFFPG